MPRGGPRPGAGRPKGSKVARTASKERQKLAESGLTPLEYLIQLVRDETAERKDRLDAAKAAAPYLHPRLSSVEVSGDLTINHEQALKELE
jgi:hypothetical protein